MANPSNPGWLTSHGGRPYGKRRPATPVTRPLSPLYSGEYEERENRGRAKMF